MLAAAEALESGGVSRLTSGPAASAMLRWSIPILLAGLGGLYSERAGVVNIGLEGMMILGTWFGAWGTLEWGPWVGMLIGLLGGAVGGLLHAIATVLFGVDHVISGVAINILAPRSGALPQHRGVQQPDPVARRRRRREGSRSRCSPAATCSASTRRTCSAASRNATSSSSPTSRP